MDVARNLLRTRYSGNVTAACLGAAIPRAEPLLRQMKSGFAVIADLTELESMELECGPHIGRLMELCKAQGVSMVIRVLPDRHKDIGLNILSLIHYRGKVKTLTCETMAEAERALA